MPDRIPELDQFLTRAKEAPMLPPSEVRRRGSRRRAVRHTGITAGALALTLVAGFGVWQSPIVQALRDSTAVPLPADPTQSPTESPSPTQVPVTVVPPTFDNLPVGEQVMGGPLPVEIREEYEGVGQAAKSFCDPGDYGMPTSILTREYGVQGYPTSVSAVVFGYDSDEAAAEAFDILHTAGVECATVYESKDYTNVRVEVASEAVPVDASAVDATDVRTGYITAVGNPPENPETGLWTEVFILQADERVLYVTNAFEGQDNNCIVEAGDPDMGQCTLAANAQAMLEQLVQ